MYLLNHYSFDHGNGKVSSVGFFCKLIFSVLVNFGKSNNLTRKLLYFCTKWSMLDLLLIAIAVTVFKLSYFTEMSVEIGSYFLCGFVILSIIFEETSY